MTSNNIFYILRHADTDKLKNVHFSEYPLSKYGLSQAEELIPYLDTLNIDTVYSSPFKRAIQTISPYNEKNKLNLNLINDLCGRKLGDIQKDEIWEFFKKSWDDPNYSYKNAETANECSIRLQNVIKSLDKNYSNSNILLVTHSNPIALFLRIYNKKIDWNWFQNMPCPVMIKVKLKELIEYEILEWKI